MATAHLIKIIKKITVGTPLTIFVPHTLEALLNSHDTEHFSVSHPTDYKLLLLTAPRITLLCCSNLNSDTLFPSITGEVLHNCLKLMDNFLTLVMIYRKFLWYF